MKATISFLSIFLFISNAFGQQSASNLNYPEVGKPMPSFFLRDISYFRKKQATEKDFLGKWLILDFWAKTCGSCVASFPRMNSIQKKFGDSVQVMMVGIQDAEKQIETIYAKYTQKEGLVMPCDFDSLIAKRFDLVAVPHIIIIDPKGIVRGVTNHMGLDEMQVFLAGGHPYLPKTYYRGHDQRYDRIPFDNQQPFLVNGNGGSQTDFEFRSVLSKWTPDHALFRPVRIDLHEIDSTFRKGMFQVIGALRGALYNYAFYGTSTWTVRDTAYFGKYRVAPVIEVSDSTAFTYRSATGAVQNAFSYSLIVPPNMGTAENMQQIMQKDLAGYFGFRAAIEERECTYYKLVFKPVANENIRTKGGKEAIAWVPKISLTATNISISRLIYLLEEGHGDDMIISDDTGINYNVDIYLDCIINDLADLKKALQRNGMDLIESKRPMKVLVIRDKK